MDRKEFLKTVAAAAIAQKLPVELIGGTPTLAAAPAVEVFAPYGLAFMVTKEMVEDEVYGSMLEVVDRMPGFVPELAEAEPVVMLNGDEVRGFIDGEYYLVKLKDENIDEWPEWLNG